MLQAWLRCPWQTGLNELSEPTQLRTCADAGSVPALPFCCSASKSATSLRSKLQSNANSTRGMLFKSALTITCEAESSLLLTLHQELQVQPDASTKSAGMRCKLQMHRNGRSKHLPMLTGGSVLYGSATCSLSRGKFWGDPGCWVGPLLLGPAWGACTGLKGVGPYWPAGGAGMGTLVPACWMVGYISAVCYATKAI